MHVIETGFAVAALVLLAVLGRAVFIYFRPERACRWCRPGGLIRGSLVGRGSSPISRRGASGAAGAARPPGATWRLGARHVHELKLSLQQAWDERE